MTRIMPGPGLLQALEDQRKEEAQQAAQDNLEMIEQALAFLWDRFIPDDYPTEGVYNFLMQTWDEVEPWFDEIREALRND